MNAEKEIKDFIRSLYDKIDMFLTRQNLLFRGEPQCYPKISSGLYRDLDIEYEGADKHIKDLEDRMIDDIQTDYGIDQDPDRALVTMQHEGAKTNLIDFTTDFNIALFFACEKHEQKDGRIILLAENENTVPEVSHGWDGRMITPGPQGEILREFIVPYRRIPKKILLTNERAVRKIIAQKSVLIHLRNGYVKDEDVRFLVIPARLKKGILNYLHRFYGIKPSTVLTDVSGYIQYQDKSYEDIRKYVFAGNGCYAKGDHENAKKHYTKCIKRYENNKEEAYSSSTPENEALYSDFYDFRRLAQFMRGMIFLREGQKEKAFEDWYAGGWRDDRMEQFVVTQVIEEFQEWRDEKRRKQHEQDKQRYGNITYQMSKLFVTIENPSVDIPYLDGVVFGVGCEDGYFYAQEITDEAPTETNLEITLPATLSQIEDWYFSVCKDGYENEKNQYILFRHKEQDSIEVTIKPKEHLKDTHPEITVKVRVEKTELTG